MRTNRSKVLYMVASKLKELMMNWKAPAFVLAATSFAILVLLYAPYIVPVYESKSMRAVEIVGSFEIPLRNPNEEQCKNDRLPSLPKGVVMETSDLEMRPLWADPKHQKEKSPSEKNLLAMAVGISQKEVVSQIVEKFLANNFTVMLFHYDGVVDHWKEMKWANDVIHISAPNQTKWWFAKRFMHPDVVAEYKFIFLWDEDLGLEHFHPGRYISIIEDEGLEISQPALDASKSQVHHQITARMRKSKVHRRTYKFRGKSRCYANSTGPPCTGWVEMMAPVFSGDAWRCVWSMIQNDLIHAWGLDMKLGYCVKGDRSKNVGVVDSEYIVHMGIPSLGRKDAQRFSQLWNTQPGNPTSSPPKDSNDNLVDTERLEVRRQSYNEHAIFNHRWQQAAEEDKCWVDLYPTSPANKT